MAPIRCNGDQLQLAAALFPYQFTEFPMKYLGILLSVRKLPRSALQPLADNVADRLPLWKFKPMNRSSHLTHQDNPFGNPHLLLGT
jgi:hypothetical protein